MKYIIKFFFSISILFVFLGSCSNEKDGNNKMVKKTVEINEAGTSITTLFKFNDNQIISSDSPKKHIDFTYEDGLISKIEIKDYDKQSIVTLEYTYGNEKLLRVTSSENYVINYEHNPDGTVSYEKVIIEDQNQQKKKFHGTLYFKNKNLIKDERVLENNADGVVSTSKISFEYDTKRNPFYNILGYNKLLDHDEAISLNNKLMTVTEYRETYIEFDQVTSSMNLYKSTFKYDTDNYPVEQLSESGIENPNYLKTEYFY